MIQVSKNQKLAEELVNSKLQNIAEHIEKILQKWKYASSQLFLDDSKFGNLRNAEDDAIVLQNLLDGQRDLHQLKKQW